MKLLLLTASLHFGGAERQLIALANGLAARGHEVAVAQFYAGGGLEAELDTERVALVNLHKRGRWDLVRCTRALARHISATQPDVVHGYLGTPNVMATVARMLARGPRLVWGVRSTAVDPAHYSRATRWALRAERALVRHADLIIANSHAGRDFVLKRGFPADRVEVVPNGIDTERFAPDPVARAAVRQELGMEDRQVLVGMAGRYEPMKGHPTFLRAAAQLMRQSRLDCRFLCLGDGPMEYRAAMRQLASELDIDGRMIWSGPRPDMPRVHNALDLFCCASAYGEGFSNVLAEALSCGVPCVATDVGDAGRIVGDATRIVPVGDDNALARAMAKALQETNKADAQALRARVVEQYSVPRLVERTEELLTGLLR